MSYTLELVDTPLRMEVEYSEGGHAADILSACHSVGTAALALHDVDPIANASLLEASGEYGFNLETGDGRLWHYDFMWLNGSPYFEIETTGWFLVGSTDQRTLLRDRMLDLVTKFGATKIELVFS